MTFLSVALEFSLSELLVPCEHKQRRAEKMTKAVTVDDVDAREMIDTPRAPLNAVSAEGGGACQLYISSQ